MRKVLDTLYYILSTLFFGVLALLFAGVCVTSLCKNAIEIYTIAGLDWRFTGNYVGLIVGFVAYLLFAVMLWIFRMRHNLDWSMKFSHELTHTHLWPYCLVARYMSSLFEAGSVMSFTSRASLATYPSLCRHTAYLSIPL